jgi:hypothetical protein
MTDLRLSAWERNDLMRVLDYAIEKKIQDYKKGEIAEGEFELDITKMNNLKCRVFGIKHEKAYIVSTNIDDRL